jgi:hypothetical protein
VSAGSTIEDEGRRAIMVEMDPEIAQTAIRRCEEIDA